MLPVEVEIKHGRIGHAVAEAFIERRGSPDDHDRLLAAPAIGREVADRLRAAGCSFLDSIGNCFLLLGRGRLLVDRRAAPRADRRGVAPAPAANPRVLFSLLANPARLGSTTRELAQHTATSRQTVATTLRALRDDGYLARYGRSQHTWIGGRTDELVDRFVAAWRGQLRPRLVTATLATDRSAEADETDIERLLEDEGLRFGFGGSAGAERIQPFYRGAATVVHIDGRWPAGWNHRLRAAPTRDGPITVLQVMGADDLDPDHRAAHPLLLYAEMQTSTDPREREFAREMWPLVQRRIEIDGGST